jgi:hypothetical protein
MSIEEISLLMMIIGFFIFAIGCISCHFLEDDPDAEELALFFGFIMLIAFISFIIGLVLTLGLAVV